MIVGLGIDVVEPDRIARALQRFGRAFAERVLAPEELAGMPDLASKHAVPWLAVRFAAKEAGAKALGTGFSQGVGFQSIVVHALESGKPELRLYGQALARATALGATRFLVSLTHGRDAAAAVVILET